MLRSFVLLVGGLASLSAVSLFAQDAALGQKYGNGVHAYFAGDYQQAYEHLTAAINAGSKDPRVFYFRGLTYRLLGRSQEAAMDFQKGAALESKDVSNFYNVGKALERVQGEARIELENYRVNARVAAMQQADAQRKARYEAVQREEMRVLRDQTLLAEPGKPAEPAAATAEPVAAPAPVAPAVPPASKAAKKPAAGAEDDIFGGATEKPAAKKPAAENPTKKPAGKKDDDNPFDS
jgi:tetratricopeptide (TPR) repeat protein